MNYTPLKRPFKKDHCGSKLSPFVSKAKKKKSKSTSLNKARFAENNKIRSADFSLSEINT